MPVHKYVMRRFITLVESLFEDNGDIKISDCQVKDSHRGEMFCYKELTVDGVPMAAADINIYQRTAYIQNIRTRTGEYRKGYAKKLVDDLFREMPAPKYKIAVSNMTDAGSAFFRKTYKVTKDGQIKKR